MNMNMNMNMPNALTKCVLVSYSGATHECLYGDGIRIIQVCGDRGVAATLMLAETPTGLSGGYLAQTLAERRYFDDGSAS